MGLEGSFNKFTRPDCGGLTNHSEWQFVIKNTNWVFSETFDLVLMDSTGEKPFYFDNVTLPPGKSLAFNSDTVGWWWHQDDYAAIIDKNKNPKKVWKFHRKEYAPGHCPECHGTHKCSACRGVGNFGLDRNLKMIWCKRCAGRGTCTTCDISYRTPSIGGGPTGLKPF